MLEKTINLLKDRDILIPRLLLMNYKNLKIKPTDLIVLIYLINNDSLFNPNQVSHDLSMSLEEAMESVNNLVSLDLIKLELKKVSNIRNEYIILDGLYNKLAYLVVKEEQATKTSNIYDTFEKEFGRTLSPFEYDTINYWLENFTEEIITLALKEAILNNITNLKYIDRILLEWKKKGIKTEKDVENQRRIFKNQKTEKKELFDYDWLNEHE